MRTRPTLLRGAFLLSRRGLVVTTFTQSLGAELLTNGDFSSWSADNPTEWTVVGESAPDSLVTQVAPGGGVGTGAARIYYTTGANTPRFFQNLTTALMYEVSANVSAHTSGTLNFSGDAITTWFSPTAARNYTSVIRNAGTIFRVGVTGTNVDATLDSVSAKQITLNAQQTANLNATHTFRFTLPGSPIAGQEVHLCYRIPASDPFLNGWDAYLRRNAGNTAWDFRLDSISAGTRTNRVNVTSVGAPDAIRVVASGNDHTCYTGVSGTYTARGSTVTNTTHNTATGINTIYSSAVTPVELRSA